MTGSAVIFMVFSFFAIFGAICMLNLYKVVHMVISLASTFLSLAVLYVLLEAEFVAFAQIMIYTGAITILMLYGIMMTRHDAAEEVLVRASHTFLSLSAVVALFGLLAYGILRSPWPAEQGTPLAENNVRAIGELLFSTYVIPFEMASVLLLAALVGAVILAKQEVDDL